ncbi:histidine kinase [Salinimicrobium marinum]|uniref:histidine kinase n=1 Tax=Salinimicrobium marinum TaxID=680283 RepID=A0A918SDI7_9FLAO|nr:ATP-binding protein [Salinimicrobium marinum]GHA33484.1 histidine kinase [Salinimicrobium marinum]
MSLDAQLYPDKIDISNCELEPIHIIGKSQSHGVILACSSQKMEITQCSENTLEVFSLPHEDLKGEPLSVLIGEEQETKLKNGFLKGEALLPEEIKIKGKSFLMLSHILEAQLLLDFEPLENQYDPVTFQRQLTRILNNLRSAGTVEGLCREAAALTWDFFDYHRIMVYRFDKEWNGEVVAEEKEEEAESWLGLRYPASDIPAQSRELFLKNRVRIIADVNDNPVPITPQLSPVTGQPLDLSESGLRGVSPIHIEYLQNMGVGASLTAAIVVNGKLWGLITCHHNSAKFLNYYQRESFRFLAQMFSNEIALRETNSFLEKTSISEEIREKLVVQINNKKPLLETLTSKVKFTDLVACGGGALFFNGELLLQGNTPSEAEVNSLIDVYLSKIKKGVFYTSKLSEDFPEAETYKKTASGILSIRISENNFIIWFRPEVLQTVEWGGNPEKKMSYNEEKQRLSPRKSFEKWSQLLTGTSREWENHDLNVVKALQENVRFVILEKQRNKIKNLNARLMKANEELELFSYGLSHDLRAPIRGISGYLKILQEDFGKKLGEGKQFVDTTLGLTEKMDLLIDDILSYSRLNSGEIQKNNFSVNLLVAEILEVFNVKMNYPKASIRVQDDMPEAFGDRRMLFQLWANLINNALKYSSANEEPQVEIGAVRKEDKIVYFVKDNGIGIAPGFQEKIFETFTRLAGEKFKGSGIGLAIVKLVTEKHEGEIWVESEPGNGAIFYFYI